MENKELYDLLNNFKSRNEAYEYFGFHGNNHGIVKLKLIANSVGFNLKLYDERRKQQHIKHCKQCNVEFNKCGNIFCSKSCAAKYNNSRRKHSEETKFKISNTLTKIVKFYEKRVCPKCGETFEVLNTNKKMCCSKKCGSSYGGRLNKYNSIEGNKISLICRECELPFIVLWNKRNQKFCCNNCKNKNKDYLSLLSKIQKQKCLSLEYRKRLRDIGRNGGFGLKGKTKSGTRYSSTLEKQCFEWLENNNIKFIPHKRIPNSSKVSDVYLINQDLWIEIDGINREKKKKWLCDDYQYWLNKLEIYKENNLKYKIIYNLEEFKSIIIT